VIYPLLLAVLLVADAPPLPPRALDVEFDAAVEGFVAELPRVTAPQPYLAAIEALDADAYRDRQAAGARLAAMCAADQATTRFLVRARAVERRAEVRYWLNRILRAAYRCGRCEGLGYCATYVPLVAGAPSEYGQPCRQCGQTEWQHGAQWNNGVEYEHSPCAECGGSGTLWNHYAVE